MKWWYSIEDISLKSSVRESQAVEKWRESRKWPLAWKRSLREDMCREIEQRAIWENERLSVEVMTGGMWEGNVCAMPSVLWWYERILWKYKCPGGRWYRKTVIIIGIACYLLMYCIVQICCLETLLEVICWFLPFCDSADVLEALQVSDLPLALPSNEEEVKNDIQWQYLSLKWREV